MKVISYALFDQGGWEFPFYLRGIFFNIRMNRLLYPDWKTVVYISKNVIYKHGTMFAEFGAYISAYVEFVRMDENPDRCEGMLWRMWPLFSGSVSRVICRDADSVATLRESICVKTWLQSDFAYHAINDNQAHAGLMGGMIGFTVEDFRRDTGYGSSGQMLKGLNLKNHGSDQNFLNKMIHPKIQNKLLLHNLSGAGCKAAKTITEVGPEKSPLWVSNLISRYIGSAGVIDFELLRFFRSADKENQKKWDEFEKRFPKIFYWA